VLGRGYTCRSELDGKEGIHHAAREGNFEPLVSVLDPDVVLRADAGPGSPLSVVRRGAETVGPGAMRFADPTRVHHPARVNGAAGDSLGAAIFMRAMEAGLQAVGYELRASRPST
jgi:hypothetical protein